MSPGCLKMGLCRAEKTAEVVEMELVVCLCMRKRDYPSVMSALLNTIILYRSGNWNLKGIDFSFHVCIGLCDFGIACPQITAVFTR